MKKAKSLGATVAFRIDSECQRALSERAESLNVSVHELARHYVLEMLSQGSEKAAIAESIVSLHTEIHTLRENLMLSVKAILTSAGKVKMEEADPWVQEVFGGK